MELSKILKDCETTGDCHMQCVAIASKISDGATIRKVFNKNDPWGENPGFSVRHLTGDYTSHFVVQVGDVILDPFLRDAGPIPADEYLARTYENAEEVRLV